MIEWLGAVIAVTATVTVLWQFAAMSDRLSAERLRRVHLEISVSLLMCATDNAEPIRRDRDDPLRTRYVFCGRLTTQTHTHDCPWWRVYSEVAHLIAARKENGEAA